MHPYTVMREPILCDLEDAVEHLVQHGYNPIGGVQCIPKEVYGTVQFIQAMYKKPTKTVKPRLSKIEYPDWFENHVWAVYPKRSGSNPKQDAYSCFKARQKEGHGLKPLMDGLKRYISYCDATNKTGTELVMQAKRFFGVNLEFKNDFAIPEQADNVPTKNDELTPWAAENGYRGAYAGESSADYRRALTALHNAK